MNSYNRTAKPIGRHGKLVLIVTNVQSLTNKTQILQMFADANQADVVCATEHWLSKENVDLYNLQDYRKTACFCRSKAIHGVVCMVNTW